MTASPPSSRVPAASSAAATAMGKANRRKDTQPELRLRRRLHQRGLRFVVNRRAEPDLRVTPDILFTRRRVAVFVDGCFWHSCPEHGTAPKANGAWWANKLAANVKRDRTADAELSSRGWTVIRVWEHEDADDAARRVEHAVRAAVPSAT